MKKYLKSLLVTITAAGLLTFFGCSAIKDVLTPAYIEPDAIEYTREKPTSFMPFTTMWDALRIDQKLDYIYSINQADLAYMLENENRKYDFLKGRSTLHIASGREFQSNVFSPQGPIGLLLPTSLTAILAAMAGGKYLKSPREKELERKVNGTN